MNAGAVYFFVLKGQEAYPASPMAVWVCLAALIVLLILGWWRAFGP